MAPIANKTSRGVRFAPSPTGRFHVGNLRTAWVSHVWARALGEPWVVRFEDIDRPRVLMAATEGQLADMAALGLVPDQVLSQTDAHDRHWQLFESAVQAGQVYPCFCSRKEVKEALEQSASAPHGPTAIYSGACRPNTAGDLGVAHPSSEPIAWRFREQNEKGHDDFIVARASLTVTSGAASSSQAQPLPGKSVLAISITPTPESFAPAYHWACAVDDYDGDYSLLVRAHDLIVAAAPQRSIQNWIAKLEGRKDFIPAAIFHTSLVVEDDGHRLEKRTQGVTLSELGPAGIDAQALLERFRRSFDVNLVKIRFPAGSLPGESAASIALSELMGSRGPGGKV